MGGWKPENLYSLHKLSYGLNQKNIFEKKNIIFQIFKTSRMMYKFSGFPPPIKDSSKYSYF